jgi:copper chaperone NosL
MKIWINDIKGDIAIINGLNHYIGMQTVHRDDFREFLILPAALLVLMMAGIAVLFHGKKRSYYLYTLAFVLLALGALVDFYIWEYNYGHNLSPQAPIKVPGMSYQPPLLGYKKLLNFEAVSMPDTGGWFMAAAILVLLTISVYEWKKN